MKEILCGIFKILNILVFINFFYFVNLEQQMLFKYLSIIKSVTRVEGLN